MLLSNHGLCFVKQKTICYQFCALKFSNFNFYLKIFFQIRFLLSNTSLFKLQKRHSGNIVRSWLHVFSSLMSQVTHALPLGILFAHAFGNVVVSIHSHFPHFQRALFSLVPGISGRSRLYSC